MLRRSKGSGLELELPDFDTSYLRSLLTRLTRDMTSISINMAGVGFKARRSHHPRPASKIDKPSKWSKRMFKSYCPEKTRCPITILMNTAVVGSS